MKAKLLALLCFAGPAAFGAVSETLDEFHGTGDFDGDGTLDLVIVDKVSGIYRLGYGQPNGTNVWVEGRPSGVEHVSGLGLGHVLYLTRDALAFTSPEANRVNVLDASMAGMAGQPTNVFLASLGPNRVVALDIGGNLNTALDDLYTPSLANTVAAPYRLTLTRSLGTSFNQLWDTNLAAEVITADRIKLKTNAASPTLVGALSRTTPNLTFAAQSLVSGTPANVAAANNLPAVDNFLFANFNNSALNQFLFYKGGGSNLVLRPVLEPVANNFQFDAGASFAFLQALRQVIAVPGATDVRLLLIFGAGDMAGVYSFDGTNAPALVHSFIAEPGQTFTGAAALGSGNLTLFSGTAGHSSSFQNWNRSGNGYVKGAGGDLPQLNSLATAANVFLFVNPPFVHPAPRLLGSLNAADWSSALNLSDPAHVRVNAEKFRNSTQGLGNPTLKDLGPAPAGAAFGLPNQIAESFSLLSFSPAVGHEVVEVSISPAPGHYPSGISVTFSLPAGTNALIVYRLSGEDWKLYLNQPVPLFKETTVSYYALAGGTKTTIRTAKYVFDPPPGSLDTDGDGVPDFVELGLGGDDAALHSKDSDGDGYSDLAEILAGAAGDPYNSSVVPTNTPRADELAAFDWQMTPLPLAGAVPDFTGSSNGTVVSAFDLHGGLLQSTATRPFATPSAYFSNLFANAHQRLYLAATEPHYGIRTNFLNGFPPGLDLRMGREMIRMLPVPGLASSLNVNYTYGGGPLATETANWIAAAQAAQAAIHHAATTNNLTYQDTLVSLLSERKIGDLLLERGLIDPTNRITLFPFRPQDAGRINPPHTNLLSLETNLLTAENLPDPAHPGHRLTNIWHRLNIGVAISQTLPMQRLRDLAAEIYRISAVSNNVAPGQYPSPVDTLRAFIETGVLHSNYLAATTLSAGDLNDAATGVTQLLAFVNTRPATNLVLCVRADSFATAGCTVLETQLGAMKALVLGDGTAFKFPDAFQLAPDSLVDVYAYTDLAPSCGADTLEVISLSLFAIPAVSSTDADGDLLSDAWECLFLAFDPNGDNDGDGVNNLQEFLDGTDPLNDASHGTSVDLSPPLVTIEAVLNGQLKLNWFWPEPYASHMDFALLATDALGQPFGSTVDAVQNLGGGNFQILLPNPGTPAKFYQVQMTLK